MTAKKYAQYGEDLILDEYFGNHVGRILELGANNGHVGSNTLHFFEKGWEGVCVEPSWRAIGAWQNIMEKRGIDAEKVQLINGAIGLRRGLNVFWDCPQSTLSTCSQRCKDYKDEWRGNAKKMWVPLFTVEDLLAIFPGPYDYISIDIEDWSIPIMRELPFDELKTKAVCIEFFGKVVFGEDESGSIIDHMAQYGFELLKIAGGNVICVKP